MGSNKVFSIGLFVIVVVFSIVLPAFSQTQKEAGVSITGTILSISQDYESLTFFEKNIGLAANTVVLHENGTKLGVHDLKPGILVVVEAVNQSKGLFATKIIIQKLRRE